MNPYTLVLDVWEGNLDIDEKILWEGGVRGLIIRLNSISGETHKDENFDAQWLQAERFGRSLYYVYTPYQTGRSNFEWMADHIPDDSPKRIYSDLEVKKLDCSPATYAKEYDTFVNLAIRYWDITTYTGDWFKPNLSYWPKTEYWWARYPYFLYPEKSEVLTWTELERKLEILRWVPNCTLGTTRLWQASGDRYKLPGCNNRCVDINVFNGTYDEYRTYLGAPNPIQVSWAWAVTNALRAQNYQIPDPY